MSADDAFSAATSEVELPSYDRSAITTGIMHLGVGGFHRAHQALAVDRLLRLGQGFEWGICGVGVLPGDRRMRQVMADQDCAYTLVEKSPDGTWTARVIGSIVDYLFAPEDPEAVIERLADPAIKIVSLTVTEGGYNFSPVTGEFDLTNPSVATDLAGERPPATVFGLVVEGLRRRRESAAGPLTVMSCDNIPGNGEVARRAFTAYAQALDPDLADWIAAEVAFPNGMVDRITPVTTADDVAAITQRFRIRDRWPVVAEPFFQWVLEDTFVAGRPAWSDAGVQLVADVEPYELMKLRLLNAGHQGLAYFGHLMGFQYAHDAAQDPTFAAYLLRYMRREAIPTLLPVPGIDLTAYTATLIERFGNGEVRDTVARLAAESSDRIPKWLVPVINANLAADGEIEVSAAIVASWARYAEGVDENGEPIELVDRIADERSAAAARQTDDPLAFVRDRDLFGDLTDQPRFVEAYLRALDSLHTRGAAATVADLAAG
ncbi:MAG: mannitol dehydrogenase family protein [Microlunatus sp.]|nr:mannitol dehydrogenase family protein [Microlunatus sp.]MDN5770297.1 mannitol dehydrogenase family protein [Microlunatus sp.]MDN5803413.1 mannitol dehydrogenase family protein [Microlunatus sp.]